MTAQILLDILNEHQSVCDPRPNSQLGHAYPVNTNVVLLNDVFNLEHIAARINEICAESVQ